VPFYLETPTVPGTATWTFYAPGSIGPITGLMFVDATFGGVSDGSIAAPFTTIQAALDAIGDATTLAEQFEGWKVIISANFYDEDLVIPQRRSIVLDCAPGVILADTFPPTTARKITWAQNLVPLGPIESYALQINNLIMFDGIELSSGGAAVDPSLELRVNTVNFVDGSGFVPPVPGTVASLDGTGLTVGDGIVEVRDCLIRAFPPATTFCVESGGNNLYVSYANSCEFDAPIQALGYGQMVNSTFSGNQTYTDQSSLGNLDRPEGFFGCQFDNNPNTFTMTVPEQFRMDGVTWNSCTNVTFVGASILSLDNPYVAGNTPAGNATWAAGGDNTTTNAIERIASALAIAIAGPIP